MQAGQPNKRSFTLSKSERLCNKKLIGDVFATGKSFLAFPLKIIYKPLALPEQVPVQVLITIPRKKFKKAVIRNKLKRWVREAFRKNKHIFYDPLKLSNKQYALVFVYIGNELQDYTRLEEKIILSLQHMAKEDEQGV